MFGLVETIAVGTLLFFVLSMYAIVQKASLKFFFQIGVGLLGAILVSWLGWSTEFGMLGMGLTLSMVYFMK
ncbi:MAG: hypothetical protein GOV01_04080 [Candidatus Altiarchaeota archaeon]|nr:hypothetical protein [Candidatus Altiarchaeota archaeon]